MKKFSEYLTEASHHFSPADFPQCVKNAREASRHFASYETRLTRICTVLNAALADGQITNPDFNSLKSDVNAFIEHSLDRPEWLLNAVWREHRGFTLDALEGLTYANQVAGKLKRAEAAKPQSDEDRTYLQWLTPLLKELVPISAAFLSLKDKIVKRVVKTQSEKDAEKQSYVKAFASQETTKIIWDALKEMTDSLKKGYAANIFVLYSEDAEAWNGKTQDEQRAYVKITRRLPEIVSAFSSLWDTRPSGMRDVWVLRPNWKKLLKAQCDQQADEMQEQFLYKNVSKLKSIVEAKGVNIIGKPTISNLSASRGIFTGEMAVHFQDRSSFTVRNKIVVKQNRYGTVFNQFPTTFHDVILPNGEPMGAPSEERMNTVFATTK